LDPSHARRKFDDDDKPVHRTSWLTESCAVSLWVMKVPQRSTPNQAAATTPVSLSLASATWASRLHNPYRRSVADLLDQLNSLFDSLPTSTSSSSSRPTSPLVSLDGSENAPLRPRTAPLRLLPDLFAAFEHKRGVQILSPAEKEQLRQMVASLPEGMEEHPVGVDEVLDLLVKMNITVPPSRDIAARPPQPQTTPSPLQRAPLVPRRLPPARLSLSRSSPSAGSPGGKTLRKSRTFDDLAALVVQQGGKYLGVGLDGPTGEGWDATEVAEKVKAVMSAKGPSRDHDLTQLLTPLTYPQLKALDQAYAAQNLLTQLPQTVEFALKGLLVGPLAWDVYLLQKALDADKTNDTLLIDLLIGRSPSDLALLRAAYSHRASHRSLSAPSTSSPSVAGSKSFDVAVLSAYSSGQLRLRKAWEVALQGRWEDIPEDVGEEPTSEAADERRKKLLREDLDQLKVALRRGGNTELASKILLARSPSYLHDLDGEFRKSTAGHSSLSKAIKQSVPLDLLQRILLHAVEGGKTGPKRNEGEEAEKSEFPCGVWRDAKELDSAVEKVFLAAFSLARLHWDRPRCLAIQQVYGQKYRRPLLDRLRTLVPATALSDVFVGLAESASLPEPVASVQDEERLEEAVRPSSRIRTTSMNGLASLLEDDYSGEDGATAPPPLSETNREADPEVGYESGHSNRTSGSEVEAGELEAEGEMSDPPSPRSPPPPLELEEGFESDMDEASVRDDATLDVSSQSALDSQPNLSSLAGRDTPTLPHSPSAPEQLDRAASPASSVGGAHRKSSSLSFRLESASHKPPPSAAGSGDRSFSSSLRHSRPIAPSRAKRRQSEDTTQRGRAASEEPLSPNRSGDMDGQTFAMRSPTPSTASRSSLSRSTSDGDVSLSSSIDSRRSAPIGMGNASASSPNSHGNSSMVGSPPTSIDTTSFHATPLSPVGDVGPSSSASASAFPGLSPPPSSPPAFDLSHPSDSDYFAVVDASPESPETYYTSLRHQASATSHSSSGGSRPNSLFGEGALGGAGGVFAPMRDTSMMSSEQVQALVRQASDLHKKWKDAEARFQASSSAYEQDQSELEARVEEVRVFPPSLDCGGPLAHLLRVQLHAELQAKRREEKELRNNEKQHLVQISSLEGDIAKLTKSLERSREAYDTMKRNYTTTCEEAERLRALVAETRRENRAAEEAMQNHALQVQQFDRDRELLQQAITKLEEDLLVARRAQDSLDDQKQENLMLKETIDRLRFDLDEMRVASRKSGSLDNGSPGDPNSPAKSLAASISKSLGREIANRMAEQEEESDSEEGDETEEEDEEVDDIIDDIIKKRGKTSSPLSRPVVTHVETSVNVCDADIQTEPTPSPAMDVQTDLSAVNIDLVAASVPEPKIVVSAPLPKTERELQEDLAKELGIDLESVKQFVEAQKSGVKSGSRLLIEAPPPDGALALSPHPRSSRSSSRIHRQRERTSPSPSPNDEFPADPLLSQYFPTSARPYVAQVLDSSITFMLYTATVYLAGVVSGSYVLPVNHHHHLAPFSVMFSAQDSTAYNSMSWEGLAVGSSGNGGLAREGLGHFLYELVWSGVRTARRVPV
ncbi:SPOSA6832_00319, partial [Sporobolomyces salmonicolor]